MTFLLTDLVEVKTVMEIDIGDKSEDIALNFYIEQISSWIQEWLNRDLELKTRTEFYSGTGTQRLCLKSRPVFPDSLSVYVDGSAYYGSAPNAFDPTASLLTYGQDYFIEIDTVNFDPLTNSPLPSTSRSGVLVRIKDVWPRPTARVAGLLSPFLTRDYGSIKVTYEAGYTADTLPAVIRSAANLGVARMRYIFPLGMEIGSESYEERSISLVTERKNYIMALIYPMIWSHRNWNWGLG